MSHRTCPAPVRVHCKCRPHRRSQSRSPRPGSSSRRTSFRTRAGNCQSLGETRLSQSDWEHLSQLTLTSIRGVHTDHAVTAVLIARAFSLVTRVRVGRLLFLQQLLDLLLHHPGLLHVVLGVGHQVVVVAGGVVVAAVQRRVVPAVNCSH